MRRLTKRVLDHFRPSFVATVRERKKQYACLGVEVLEGRCVPATASGVLSGVAFIDADGNGVHAATEPVLPGVPVTLSGTTTQGGAFTPVTAITDGAGAFQFLNVLPGTYHLKA